MTQDDINRMTALPRLFKDVQWTIIAEFKAAGRDSRSGAVPYLVNWLASTSLDSSQMQDFFRYMLWSSSSGGGSLEEAARIASRAPGVGDAARAAGGKVRDGRHSATKRDGAKMPLKGPKTPFMQEQLKAFKKYLGKMGYSGDASKLYAWADRCWSASQAKWDVAKSAAGTRRGYSCPKALADAYRNLTSEQRALL